MSHENLANLAKTGFKYITNYKNSTENMIICVLKHFFIRKASYLLSKIYEIKAIVGNKLIL